MRASFRRVASRAAIVLAVVCATVPLAACGNDGGADDGASGNPTGDVEEFCQLVEQAPSATAGFDPTTAEGADAIRAYYEQLEAVAPEAIRDDVTTVLEGTDLLVGRTFENSTTEEVQAVTDASARISDFVGAECPQFTTDTTATDGS